jgi:hypothetical protein
MERDRMPAGQVSLLALATGWAPSGWSATHVQYFDFVGVAAWTVDVTAQGGRWRVTAVTQCE